MQIDIKLYGPLRDYLPRSQKGRGQLSLHEGATVEDAIKALNINHPVLAAVNDAHESEWEIVLQAGDKLTLFEPAAGG